MRLVQTLPIYRRVSFILAPYVDILTSHFNNDLIFLLNIILNI
jgi:hypothetical protein